MSKVATLEEAASLIEDGSVVALQGVALQCAPMALVRELIRRRTRGLRIIGLVQGIAVDWLAAAQAMDRFIGCAVTMEQIGLCQQYRRAVEQGRVTVQELSELALAARLEAAGRGLPSMPARGAIGTDLLALLADDVRLVSDPLTGEQVLACRALAPDFTILHAHRADAEGNVQFDLPPITLDVALMPQAAKRVIVTVEQIVPTAELRRHPERTIWPGFAVEAVVEAPFGAYPTAMFGRYAADIDLHRCWAAVAREDSAARKFVNEHICTPKSHDEYLQAVVGPERLAALQKNARVLDD